jgi:hypothetical protein
LVGGCPEKARVHRDLAGRPTLPGVTPCQGGGNTVRRAKGARRWMFSIREVCAMQDAEPVLNVLRDRGIAFTA